LQFHQAGILIQQEQITRFWVINQETQIQLEEIFILGDESGYTNTNGVNNVFSGYQSGYLNTSGQGNTFSGYKSGYSNTYGAQNAFLGYYAGYTN